MPNSTHKTRNKSSGSVYNLAESSTTIYIALMHVPHTHKLTMRANGKGAKSWKVIAFVLFDWAQSLLSSSRSSPSFFVVMNIQWWIKLLIRPLKSEFVGPLFAPLSDQKLKFPPRLEYSTGYWAFLHLPAYSAASHQPQTDWCCFNYSY